MEPLNASKQREQLKSDCPQTFNSQLVFIDDFVNPVLSFGSKLDANMTSVFFRAAVLTHYLMS